MKTRHWFVGVVLAAGAVLAVALSVRQFMTQNQKPLHPDLGKISAVVDAEPSPKWAAAVKRSRMIARQGLAQQNVPGLSVAVGAGGELVWAEGFGWADLESQTPVTPESRFRIGHVSKSLTSAAVGRLVDQGRLRLDDEIQDYVPAYPKKDWPVTLRQLMGHLAGVRHYRDDEWGDKPTVHCDRASDGVQSFANDRLLFEPETKYSYSTYGWVLVSAAVEAAAGEPFAQVMRAQVFDPIGMSHTRADAPKEQIPNRVTSYFRGNFEQVLTTGVDYSCFAGGGAFLSTPSDLVRFGITIADGKFLQPATLRRLQTRQELKSGEATSYGLGWMLDTAELAGERTPMVGHSSRMMEGASDSFWMFPERGLVVAVTSNMSFADMRSLALAIAGEFAKK